ncbi:MAG: trypsin-like serine peptidase [Solirubrobacterales bacterium]
MVSQGVNPNEAAVKSSWTREEMMEAIPADIPGTAAGAPSTTLDIPEPGEASVSARRGDFKVKDPSAFPVRMHGKVFFRVGNQSYSCSGTVISTRFGNAVATAAHCVFDLTAKRFANGWAFAPAYNNGSLPFGLFVAARLIAPKRWVRKQSLSHDFGIAILFNAASGASVSQTVGGARRIAFKTNPRGKYTSYGYPADPKPIFNSEFEFGCNGRFAGRDRGRPKTLALNPCHMGHGASGGGWVSHGFLSSVQSYSYCESTPRTCAFVFGPYLGEAARKLYASKAVGGTITPGITIASGPRKVRKHKVHLELKGIASTPLKYQCKLDRRRWKRCKSIATIRRVSHGRHVVRVRAFDQTGRRSGNTAKRKFRVLR